MSHRLLSLLLLVLCATARAQSDDPDEEIARRRFRQGQIYYSQNDYEKALVEFQAARRVKEAPALDFNIARCLDRLERFNQAIVEYESYLQKLPNAPDAADVRTRVAKLRARTGQAEPPKPEPKLEPQPEPPPKPEPPKVSLAATPQPPPSWAPGIAVGAVAIAIGITGAGVLGHGAAQYNDLDSRCGLTGVCNPTDVRPIESQIYAGGALLGIAAAVAVVDVVILVRTSRRAKW